MKVGDTAPSVKLEVHTGASLNLADFRGTSPVVLFFYPANDTPICTREACTFRDTHEDFADLGAEVIGVSADSIASHQSFAARYALPYLLVSDREGALRRAFGVPRTLGILDGRVTYVIDSTGIVRHIFSARFAADQHVREAIDILRQIVSPNDENRVPREKRNQTEE